MVLHSRRIAIKATFHENTGIIAVVVETIIILSPTTCANSVCTTCDVSQSQWHHVGIVVSMKDEEDPKPKRTLWERFPRHLGCTTVYLHQRWSCNKLARPNREPNKTRKKNRHCYLFSWQLHCNVASSPHTVRLLTTHTRNHLT